MKNALKIFKNDIYAKKLAKYEKRKKKSQTPSTTEQISTLFTTYVLSGL